MVNSISAEMQSVARGSRWSIIAVRLGQSALLAASVLALACVTNAAALRARSDIASRYNGSLRLMFASVVITDIDRSVKIYSEVIGLVVKRERRRTDFTEIFIGFPTNQRWHRPLCRPGVVTRADLTFHIRA